MRRLARFLIILAMLLVTGAALNGYLGNSKTGSAAMAGQDAINLDRRLSTLEQRIYSIEGTMRQLQMQLSNAAPNVAVQNHRDPEIDRLRLDLDLLQRRLGEVECAALKLDERTLSASSRDARRALQQSADPCRVHPEAPIQLSSRRP